MEIKDIRARQKRRMKWPKVVTWGEWKSAIGDIDELIRMVEELEKRCQRVSEGFGHLAAGKHILEDRIDLALDTMSGWGEEIFTKLRRILRTGKEG